MRKIMNPILVTLALAAPALADGKTSSATDKVIWEEGDADITASGKVVWEEADADIVRR